MLTHMQDLRERMLALEAQRDEYSSKEWQAVKNLRTANKLLDRVREQADKWIEQSTHPSDRTFVINNGKVFADELKAVLDREVKVE